MMSIPDLKPRALYNGRELIEYPSIAVPDTVQFPVEHCLLVPGIVNAHCHFEYSFLAHHLSSNQPFTNWLSEVIWRRRETHEDVVDQSLQNQIAEAAATGTTGVYDIITRGNALAALNNSPLDAWAFLEVISLNPPQADQAMMDLAERISGVRQFNQLHPAISPHASYTVSFDLAEKIGAYAAAEQLPLAIHLAETLAEREMLLRGSGNLYDLFRARNVLPQDWTAPELSPIVWAEQTGLLGPRTLAIHCNYVTDEEIEILARRNATVVYCPRSHAWFGHERYPLDAFREAGLNVCLGTDSLASNHSLNMLEEMRLVHRKYPHIPASDLFTMVTENALRPVHCVSPAPARFSAIYPCPPLSGSVEQVLEQVLENSACRMYRW